ncbi:hypothetical protein KKB83_01420, partial [Patescibacteria group bacterium]|nr:hypothetical protein [Patescibacteria group bacterium]
MLKIEFLLTLVTLVYLLGYTFFPNRIHVDKYTLSLLAMLFLLAILPTLSSGSISYLFSFKRSLKLAENAMKRITGNDKTVGKNESKISADERGPFFTTTQV